MRAKLAKLTPALMLALFWSVFEQFGLGACAR